VVQQLATEQPHIVYGHIGLDNHRLESFAVPAGVGGLWATDQAKLYGKIRQTLPNLPIVLSHEGGYSFEGLCTGPLPRSTFEVVSLSSDAWMCLAFFPFFSPSPLVGVLTPPRYVACLCRCGGQVKALSCSVAELDALLATQDQATGPSDSIEDMPNTMETEEALARMDKEMEEREAPGGLKSE
jgi:hypothetical protein